MDIIIDDLSDHEFLTRILCEPLKNSLTPKPIEFLLDIVKHDHTPDHHKVNMMKYISDVYHEQIMDHKTEFCKGLTSIRQKEKWLETMEIFSDSKYDWIRENLIESTSILKYVHVYHSYFRIYNENLKMKKEIDVLKNKLEQFELHMKYMPEGEGYYETKEHFETSQKLQTL